MLLRTRYGIDKDKIVNDGFAMEKLKRSYHPVREYLRFLEWDGTERAATAVCDYLGADDTPLNRAMTRLWLIAAVKRIMQPGCKFDYVLILTGAQGVGKSTFFRTLASPRWFNDGLPDVTKAKDAGEQIQGAWITEIAELNGIRTADVRQTSASPSSTRTRYFPRRARAASSVGCK